MASQRAKPAMTIGIVAVLFLGVITLLILTVRAHMVQTRALAELKKNNPVEYHVLHTPMVQSESELKNELVGTWELAGAKSRMTGQFFPLPPHSGYFKMFTLTNWAIVTYDADSNVVYSASGHYTLQGDSYTESIEAATGRMIRFRGQHPRFKIRVDGDNYYQMGAEKNPVVVELWQRVEQ
jgi:hypothetical protein